MGDGAELWSGQDHDETGAIAVREIIDRTLSHEQAAFFIAHYFEEWSAHDIAEAHGLPVTRVYRTLHEAREVLREALAEQDLPIAAEVAQIGRALLRRPELDSAVVRERLEQIRQWPAHGWEGGVQKAWRQLQDLRRDVSDSDELTAEQVADRLASVLTTLQTAQGSQQGPGDEPSR
jgi:hypothetical protein